MGPMRSSRSRRLFWLAIAAVGACALFTGWFVFTLVARPLPADPVQVVTSPEGQWQVRTWFVGGGELGNREGVLRVDVTDLSGARGLPRTIYVDPVESRDAARRFLSWADASHLELPLAGGAVVVLDVAHAPTQSTPGEFATLIKATAAATVALLAVLVAGILGALLVGSWLIRRDEARWEAWPVDWTEGRRHAPQG